MAQTAIKLPSHGSERVRAFDPHAMQELIFGAGVPESEQFRRYYGRSVNPWVIEQVIRAADLGFMRDQVAQLDPPAPLEFRSGARAQGS